MKKKILVDFEENEEHYPDEMKDKETLAVIIPVYNEEECIDELVKRLLGLKEKLKGVDVFFVFVNDGSEDGSLDLLSGYTNKYDFFKVLNLSKNFGHQLAITAGLDYVDTDYVAIIDADLQDPPELIEELYKRIKEGYDVVYAKRNERKGESSFKLTTARCFYWLINKLCSVDIPSDTGDFRIIRRNVLLELKKMREKHRFVRGMVPWIGFTSAPFYYDREKRFAGDTKFPFTKMVRFALDAIFSFSIIPLRMATYLGFFVAFCGVVGIFFILMLLFVYENFIPGVSSTLFTVFLIGGVQLIMTGILGEYIGRIYEEIKRRPLYVVGSSINLSPPKDGEKTLVDLG